MRETEALRRQIGRRIMAGFEGVTVPEALEKLVREHYVTNFVLFKRNVTDNAQLKALCDALRELVLKETGLPALIAIDHEGGTVTRLGADATAIPCAMGLSASRDPEDAYLAGLLIGTELNALGVNVNFAPCADVNSNPDNPVVGVRSFSCYPETTGDLAVRFIKGQKDGGVLCSAKHFPGHGDTHEDSHLSLPCVDKPLEELAACELRPFIRAFDAQVPSVMTAHIRYPRIEPDAIPATMSRRIITGLLRDTLGYRGLVFSDCMMMQAIAGYFGTVNSVAASLCAGVDIAIVSHDVALAAQACEAAAAAAVSGRLSREDMNASLARIEAFHALMPKNNADLSVVGCPRHREIARGMWERSLTPYHMPAGGLPPIGFSPLFIGHTQGRVTGVQNPEEDKLHFAFAMRNALGGEAMTLPDEPDGQWEEAFHDKARHASAVIAGVSGASRSARRGALARVIENLDMPKMIVELGSPYALASLPKGTVGLAAYTCSADSLQAIAEALRGAFTPKGRLPVDLPLDADV